MSFSQHANNIPLLSDAIRRFPNVRTLKKLLQSHYHRLLAMEATTHTAIMNNAATLACILWYRIVCLLTQSSSSDDDDDDEEDDEEEDDEEEEDEDALHLLFGF